MQEKKRESLTLQAFSLSMGVSVVYDGATGHIPQRHWDIYYNSILDFSDKEIVYVPWLFLLEARLSGLGRMWLSLFSWICSSGPDLLVSSLFWFGACKLQE